MAKKKDALKPLDKKTVEKLKKSVKEAQEKTAEMDKARAVVCTCCPLHSPFTL